MTNVTTCVTHGGACRRRPRRDEAGRAPGGRHPHGVCELARRGVPVLVEAGAGLDSGIGDGEYRAAGAEVLDRAVDVWACADLVCNVKEP
jgi:alanine dehydrogenase